ncbi:hypothetical protein Ct61P_13657 [Colletotrichum tofieldiae]|nr:hypothetical protein Ct61P_13657 [Colletotrichum tofieldiae]
MTKRDGTEGEEAAEPGLQVAGLHSWRESFISVPASKYHTDARCIAPLICDPGPFHSHWAAKGDFPVFNDRPKGWGAAVCPVWRPRLVSAWALIWMGEIIKIAR